MLKTNLHSGIFCGILIFILMGCNPENNKVLWRADDIEDWQYELVSDEIVMVYRFRKEGLVAIQAGRVGGPLTAPMERWELDENGMLAIYGPNDFVRLYRLISLTHDSAEVMTDGASQVFQRSRIKRSGNDR